MKRVEDGMTKARTLTIIALALAPSACTASASIGDDGLGGRGGGGASGGGSGIAGAAGFPSTPPGISVLDAHPVLGETKAEVVIVLSQPFAKSLSVDFSTKDGTATGDPSGSGDYVPVQKTVTFNAGQKSAVVEVPVNTPYKTLTLETALDKAFATKLSNPTEGATLADADGVVTLAHAGMVIETPLASKLFDGDIIPDFNGDQVADLSLTGSSGTATMLLTPGTTFEEAAHVVVDDAYLDGNKAFSWQVSTAYASGFFGLGFVAADHAQAWDANQDGIDDALIVGENKAYMLYGHAGPFQNFASGDPRLSDGVNGTQLADIEFGYGAGSIQTGDFDGDGYLDWGQSHFWSSVSPGSTNKFRGWYGSAGPWSGSYNAPTAFSFLSGATPVGQSSLVEGTTPGVRSDLNGDSIDDLVFGGIAANDGQYGGNYLYVLFGGQQQLSQSGATIKGTLDGSNGIEIDNDDYGTYKSSGGFGVHDSGDVNGDGVQDLVVTGAGTPMTVIFGKKTPFASGAYANLQAMGSEAAYFNCDQVASARTGDMNKDGIDDVVFITENKLRVLWGKKDLTGKDIFGTQYPEMGEIEIDPASGLDSVTIVGDLDGDGTQDVVVMSSTWNGNTGGALVLFGKTLTRLLGGPNFDVPPIK
jgi:FG-GAP-like repeat/Calx-beta domain